MSYGLGRPLYEPHQDSSHLCSGSRALGAEGGGRGAADDALLHAPGHGLLCVGTDRTCVSIVAQVIGGAGAARKRAARRAFQLLLARRLRRHENAAFVRFESDR